MNLIKKLLVIGLFAVFGANAIGQVLPSTATRVTPIKRGKWLPYGQLAYDWNQVWNGLNDNDVSLDTAIYNLDTRVGVLEAGGLVGHWAKSGTNLSPIVSGDDILLETNTERIYFGDGDSYFYESIDDNLYIATEGTNRVGVTPTTVAFSVPIQAFSTGTTDVGASDRWWRNSYVEQYFIEDVNTKIGLDVSGNMILEDAVTGSKTLAELASGTAYSAGKGLTLTSTTFSLGADLTGDVVFTGSELYDFTFGQTGADRIGEFKVKAADPISIETESSLLLSHNSSGKYIVIQGSSMRVGDTDDSKGLEYLADYSANATARSLLDSAHIASMIAAGGGGSGVGDSVSILYDWYLSAIPLDTAVRLKVDTTNICTMIAGFGDAVDTLINTTTGYLEDVIIVPDTAVITEVIVWADSAGLGVTPNFTIQGRYTTSLANAGTTMFTSAQTIAGSEPVTTGERLTTFASLPARKVPPGDYLVRFDFPTITAKFTKIIIVVKGYYLNAS